MEKCILILFLEEVKDLFVIASLMQCLNYLEKEYQHRSASPFTKVIVESSGHGCEMAPWDWRALMKIVLTAAQISVWLAEYREATTGQSPDHVNTNSCGNGHTYGRRSPCHSKGIVLDDWPLLFKLLVLPLRHRHKSQKPRPLKFPLPPLDRTLKKLTQIS